MGKKTSATEKSPEEIAKSVVPEESVGGLAGVAMLPFRMAKNGAGKVFKLGKNAICWTAKTAVKTAGLALGVVGVNYAVKKIWGKGFDLSFVNSDGKKGIFFGTDKGAIHTTEDLSTSAPSTSGTEPSSSQDSGGQSSTDTQSKYSINFGGDGTAQTPTNGGVGTDDNIQTPHSEQDLSELGLPPEQTDVPKEDSLECS